VICSDLVTGVKRGIVRLNATDVSEEPTLGLTLNELGVPFQNRCENHKPDIP
jgi:hypothetical protein